MCNPTFTNVCCTACHTIVLLTCPSALLCSLLPWRHNTLPYCATAASCCCLLNITLWAKFSARHIMFHVMTSTLYVVTLCPKKSTFDKTHCCRRYLQMLTSNVKSSSGAMQCTCCSLRWVKFHKCIQTVCISWKHTSQSDIMSDCLFLQWPFE